jgi:butyryl-CoA dehydrogenase
MFGFTDEMTEKAAQVREFCNEWIIPNLAEIDAGKCCPDYIWEEWCKIPGFASPAAPKIAGGMELPFSTCCAMWEELGKADLGCGTGFGVNNLGSFPILLTGTDEQKIEHFGNLLQGKYGSFGLTEKGAGSDAGAVATEAVKKGDHYILNGDKCYITQSGKAIDGNSTLALCASTDKSLGSKGLTMFLVPGNTPGLTWVKEEDKMGIRGSQTCELHLENVELHESRILGGPEKGIGFGFKTAMMTLDAGRAVVAAQANGLALAVIEELVRYCNEHEDSGRPLSKNNAAKFKIAELEATTQACRQMVYHTAFMRDAGLNHGHESCISKIVATENAINCTRVAMDIMGVNGLKKGSLMEKLYRDARILAIYEGTNQVQRLVVTNGLFPKKKK